MKKDLNIITKDGFNFGFDENECHLCEGSCCIGESGYIWITKSEIENLAKFLSIDVDTLAMNSLKKIGYKYSIKEKEISKGNFACVFFDLKKRCCSVYEARPTQCRTFPFWEYFKNNEDEVYKECQAITSL